MPRNKELLKLQDQVVLSVMCGTSAIVESCWSVHNAKKTFQLLFGGLGSDKVSKVQVIGFHKLHNKLVFERTCKHQFPKLPRYAGGFGSPFSPGRKCGIL